MPGDWPDRNGQFLVTEHSAPARGTARRLLATLAVDTFGKVPMAELSDALGTVVGMLIGTPIDIDAGPVTGTLVIDAKLDRSTVDDWVERHIYRLAGSFLLVLDVPGCRRIYLDADASRSLVYEAASRQAGATAMTLLDEDAYRRRLRTGLHRKLEVDQGGWFPAGLTAHEGISRLLCNHYLDLDTWEQHRHWPLAPIAETTEPAAVFDAMLERIRKMVFALRGQGHVSLALTAGTDSRFVLSALRPVADTLDFVTVAALRGKLDVASARALSRRFGLRHRVLSYRHATPSQAEAWEIRAGHCVAGANKTMHPSVEPLRGQYFLGGLGGEVGRGFLWLGAGQDSPVDARNIVARLKLPPEPEVVAAIARWLEPIAHFDTLLKLDLAYLELRMGSWAFADAYANPVENELHPMISRANYCAMLSIPPELRRDGAVFRDAITRAWPELLALPINRYGNWRDAAKRVTDALSNPRQVARKLRQLAQIRRRAV